MPEGDVAAPWFYGEMPRIPRRMLILMIWTAATAFAISFAAWRAFGPVVLVLSRSHGVHLGDLVATAGAFGGAALLTSRLARVPDRSSATLD